MARDVLVPIDRSDAARAAIDFAIETYPAATITLLHVLNPGELYAYWADADDAVVNVDELVEDRRRRGEQLLADARNRVESAGLAADTVLETGRPARAIVEYATAADIDHIVMGSHGRTGASRILLGSVAELVARRSPVPVTIVR